MRQEPPLDHPAMLAALGERYGLRAEMLSYIAAGEYAACYAVEGEGKRHFLKLWPPRPTDPEDKVLSSQLRLTHLMRARNAFHHVAAPLAARDGTLIGRIEGRSFALFPFVSGRRPRRTPELATDLGQAIAELHQSTSILTDVLPRREKLEVPFAEELPLLLSRLAAADPRDPALRRTHASILPVAGAIADTLAELMHLRDRAGGGAWVICHRDLGPHNLILDARKTLVFIDWDDVALAPPEHDLICGCNAWFRSVVLPGEAFDVADDGGAWFRTFLAAYVGGRGAPALSFERFAFAFLRRLLDDIHFRLRDALDPTKPAQDREHGAEIVERWIMPVFHRRERTLAMAAEALAAAS